jgi:Ca2+:H+ antiporter
VNLYYLLIFIPIAVGLSWSGANPLWVFATAALTILPLSKVVGTSTETLGYYVGPTLGGLLNASMGNAPELIIRGGNISSILNAIVFARKNQMDLAVNSVIGAATQIALLVAPLLIFASLFLSKPMDLLFNRIELVALIIAVFITRNITIDGESDWLEGTMLIAVYVMLGIGFYYAV